MSINDTSNVFNSQNILQYSSLNLISALEKTQQNASSFDAMLSLHLHQDGTSPFPLRDQLPRDLESSMKELCRNTSESLLPDVGSSLEELRKNPLDLLPPSMRAAIESMDQGPQPAVAPPPVAHESVDQGPQSAVAPPPIAEAPIKSERITWNGGSLSQAELQIVAVLNRHKDLCPLSWQSLTDKANDPSTPPDLKAAIEGLQQDPELFYAIGSQGDGRCGGKITAKDLSEFSSHHSQVAAYQGQQAQSYAQNYIPSDSTGNAQPSVMTLNDATRELYRYSENLPKNLSLADFKQIVDGDAKTGKCPPQVIAAAQYFVSHPNEWKQLYGGSIDKVHKEDFLQVASSSMSLTQTELNTLKTINSNQQKFFGNGDLTRDKLASMAQDKSLDPKLKEAASQLLSDPLLFSLLNNSITGYKTHNSFFDFGGGHTVDSGNISNKDFGHFYSSMSSANRTVQQPKTHAPETAAEQDAVSDMMTGRADQPDTKSAKKNGGAFIHTVGDVLKVYSTAADWAATAVGLLSFIPVVGQVADAVSMTLAFEAQAANLVRTAITGGNMKQALIDAGINIGAQALSLIAGPEVKLAIRNGLVKKALEEAATAGIDLPISMAQSYAEDYLSNLQARLPADPMQAAGLPSPMGLPIFQNVA
ncbi:Nodulation outer protein X [Mesorhizobium prunaredense]|uniref:Nodulation outer protein X n=1 Tax=Mesorhizobium prunaredense TaxID=1631249 RepID=A0A1R3V4E9_9HYPH|nr:HrpF/NolX family T3SS translocon protein [Mesorhizobium prunaredense]SIT54771.1 Nodulation outer protein X [Mesorhizobium prunaredense]